MLEMRMFDAWFGIMFIIDLDVSNECNDLVDFLYNFI